MNIKFVWYLLIIFLIHYFYLFTFSPLCKLELLILFYFLSSRVCQSSSSAFHRPLLDSPSHYVRRTYLCLVSILYLNTNRYFKFHFIAVVHLSSQHVLSIRQVMVWLALPLSNAPLVAIDGNQHNWRPPLPSDHQPRTRPNILSLLTGTGRKKSATVYKTLLGTKNYCISNK